MRSVIVQMYKNNAQCSRRHSSSSTTLSPLSRSFQITSSISSLRPESCAEVLLQISVKSGATFLSLSLAPVDISTFCYIFLLLCFKTLILAFVQTLGLASIKV